MYVCLDLYLFAGPQTSLRHLQSLKRPTPMQIHLISHLTQQSLSSMRLIRTYNFDFWSMNIIHTYMLLFTTRIHIYIHTYLCVLWTYIIYIYLVHKGNKLTIVFCNAIHTDLFIWLFLFLVYHILFDYFL